MFIPYNYEKVVVSYVNIFKKKAIQLKYSNISQQKEAEK